MGSQAKPFLHKGREAECELALTSVLLPWAKSKMVNAADSAFHLLPSQVVKSLFLSLPFRAAGMMKSGSEDWDVKLVKREAR